MKYAFQLILIFTLFFVSCNENTSSDKLQKVPQAINLTYMDTLTKPNEDFFRYVNGTWFDSVKIPSDRSRWGSFDELRKETDNDVMSIVKKAIKNPSLHKDSDQGKAISLFKSIVDTITRNKLGIKPIKPYLDKVNTVNTPKDIELILTEIGTYVNIGFLSSYVYIDAKNSNENSFYISTGSLGLPDREYYVSDSEDNKNKRTLYLAHIEKMLKLFGDEVSVAKDKAKKVLNLETILATAMLDRVEKRDRRKTYNPMFLSKAKKLLPSIHLHNYIKAMGITKIDTVVITQPKYIKALEGVFKSMDVASWRAYMSWTIIRDMADVLSTDIEKANWEFYGKILGGAKKQKPLEERALSVVNSTINEAIGKLYVAEKFPPQAKAKAEEMISYLFKAYEKRIKDLPWMTEKTKRNALKKLSKYRIKIGYPNKWKSYSEIAITSPEDGGTYFENIKKYSIWTHKDNISDFGKPVDKDRWGMPPQTVNAYYNPSNNEIVFPAAIMQPPFYNYKADAAVNFGGMGAVIGHEISHGFDDSGARYDSDGNLKNWWTNEDLEQFSSLGKNLANQYSKLEPLPGIFVDGEFTLGENIGDLGGIYSAFEGLMMFLKDKGGVDKIDGFTPQQRFFISWATIWRTKLRDEAVKRQVKTDPHSPGQYRAIMPLKNMDAFYKAFDIKEGDRMYISPENRVKIW